MKSFTYLQIITYAQTFLSAVVAVMAFFRFRRRQKITKLIGVIFAVGCVTNVVSLIFFFSGLGKHSNSLVSFYEVANFLFACIIFNKALNGRYYVLIRNLFIQFIIFAIGNFLFIQKYDSLNTLTYVVGSICIMVMCVLYFYRLMVDLPAKHVQHLPMFWYAAGFLVYCSGTLLLFIVHSYLVHVMRDNMIEYWFFHNCMSIVEHILILIGLRMDFISQLPVKTSEQNYA